MTNKPDGWVAPPLCAGADLGLSLAPPVFPAAPGAPDLCAPLAKRTKSAWSVPGDAGVLPQPPPAGEPGDKGVESPVGLCGTPGVATGTTEDATEDAAEEDAAEDGTEERKRRKIPIRYLTDKNKRHITFSKRKAGLMKKAHELTVLTGAQALLIIASDTNHVYTFATEKLRPMISEEQCRTLLHSCLAQAQSLPHDALTLGLGVGRLATLGPGLVLEPEVCPAGTHSGTVVTVAPAGPPLARTRMPPPKMYTGPTTSTTSNNTATATTPSRTATTNSNGPYAGPTRRRAAKPHPVPAPVPHPMPIAQRALPPLPPLSLQRVSQQQQPPQQQQQPCAIPACTPVYRAPAPAPPHPVPVVDSAPMPAPTAACVSKLVAGPTLLPDFQQLQQMPPPRPRPTQGATGQFAVAVNALVSGRAPVAFLPEWQPYPSDTSTDTSAAPQPQPPPLPPFCT